MPNAKIDFAKVRRAVTFQQLLQRYGASGLYKGSGPEKRGPCPFFKSPSEKATPCSINFNKGTWYCFCPLCKMGGNIIDFVARVQNCTPYQAASHLNDIFQCDALINAEMRQPVPRKTKQQKEES